jgi:hypothetical protein
VGNLFFKAQDIGHEGYSSARAGGVPQLVVTWCVEDVNKSLISVGYFT